MVEKLTIVPIEQQPKDVVSVLKVRALEVNFPLSNDDKEIIEQMKIMLFDLQGVGLAAPQVGIGKRIILVYIPETAALLRENVRIYPMHVLINPEYQVLDEHDKKSDFEGCYSVKSVYGKVPRYDKINLTYQDEDGNKIEKIVEGFYARVLQHEIDHVNGLLITDRLTPDCLQGTFEEMLAIRRSELSEEKQKVFDDLVKKKGMIKDDFRKQLRDQKPK